MSRPIGTPPLPPDFGLRLDRSIQRSDSGRVLVGGSPLRLLALSDEGAAVVTSWAMGELVGGRGSLARRLVDAGVAHPIPPRGGRVAEVTVVIATFGRSDLLARALASIAPGIPVIVVDDGSPDHASVASVAERFGAEYLRHDGNRGPAAGRNSGAALATTPLIAFLDSDAVLGADSLGTLAAHFADPAVGAVAPRVRSTPASVDAGMIERYEQRRSPLDLGDAPAMVAPRSRISYVPAACLIVRRDAFLDAGGFDESLRYGEDVDFVWRVRSNHWSVRYEPEATVGHENPRTLADLIGRRLAYGSSAAPLATRHPGNLAPAECSVYTAVAWTAAAAGHPVIGLVAAIGSASLLPAKLPQITATRARRLALNGHCSAGRMFLTAVRRAWLPVVACSAIRSRSMRRVLAVALLTVPPVQVIDDASYCAGVWLGCWRERSIRALLPRFSGFPGRRRSAPAATKRSS